MARRQYISKWCLVADDKWDEFIKEIGCERLLDALIRATSRFATLLRNDKDAIRKHGVVPDLTKSAVAANHMIALLRVFMAYSALDKGAVASSLDAAFETLCMLVGYAELVDDTTIKVLLVFRDNMVDDWFDLRTVSKTAGLPEKDVKKALKLLEDHRMVVSRQVRERGKFAAKKYSMTLLGLHFVDSLRSFYFVE